MKEASAELLAARADVWAFLAEPYHLSDWWPGVTGVDPDRRGFAVGARWRARTVQEPMSFGIIRFPSMGRPSGRTTEQILVITDIQPYERWSWEMVTPLIARRDKTVKSISVEVQLASVDREHTQVTIAVSGWGASELLARTALKRLFDLVQTAATL